MLLLSTARVSTYVFHGKPPPLIHAENHEVTILLNIHAISDGIFSAKVGTVILTEA
jgi:hypothetical protein